jgi:hypothetical protein
MGPHSPNAVSFENAVHVEVILQLCFYPGTILNSFNVSVSNASSEHNYVFPGTIPENQ